MLLILTVGTGTAGKHSDVAAGLARTIDLVAPRLFWLVPSQSKKSLPVADLIRESVHNPATFQSWADGEPYRSIADPDDIHQCREALREVIRRAKQALEPGERLVVNPTSGTKQMSAGATLAALDEEIGEIMFTVGSRADGVVITGTEKAKLFSTETFFFERDLRIARNLFEHGAFHAAARILRHYTRPEIPPAGRPEVRPSELTAAAIRARETALCLHEWQRMNYPKAASHAARISDDLHRHLARLAAADRFSAEVLGDLLAGADELSRWGDSEEALARYYRGAEQAAKVRLAQAHYLKPPYQLDDLVRSLPPGHRLTAVLRGWRTGGSILLTAQRAWEVLDALQDPIAAAYFADKKLTEGLQRRNETMYGHGLAGASSAEVQAVADRLRHLLREHLPAAISCWTTARRPRSIGYEPRL